MYVQLKLILMYMLNQPLNMLTNAFIYYNNRSFACSWWILLKMYKTKNVNLPPQPPWDIGALPGNTTMTF